MNNFFEALTYLLPLIAIVVCLVRMLIRMVFFKKKLNIPAKKACIPVYSSLLPYKPFGKMKLAAIGAGLHITAFACIMGMLQYFIYANTINVMHQYGILFENFTPIETDTAQILFEGLAGLLFIAGALIRYFINRNFLLGFGTNKGSLRFIGMLFPGILELILLFNKSYQWILNKKPKDMTRDEYILYTHLTDK